MGCLAGLHRKYPNNPIIGYLNINSLRNKIIDLRHVVSVSQPDILTISETKLDDTFPDVQFRMDGYYSPAQFRRDRNKHGGGLMVFIRNGIPVKRAKTFEPSNQEAICFEVTITKRKWIIYAFYRSESYSKLDVFPEEFKKSVDKAINKYENIMLMGDINVDMSNRNTTGAGYADVSEFCDIFSIKNLIKDDTCFSSIAKHPSLIDIILTNRSQSFQNSVAMETGVSDHHKMIVTVMKNHIIRLQPYKIQYRNYQGFSPDAFVNDLIHTDLGAALHYSRDANVVYNDFCSRFRKVLDRHAPLKSKFIRGNQAPFMTKELSKGIMTRSELKNKFNRHKTKANWTAYKIQRDKCVQLRKTAVKNHFLKITETGLKLLTNHFGEQSSRFSVPKVLMITMTLFLKKTETSLKIIKSYQRSLTISM